MKPWSFSGVVPPSLASLETSQTKSFTRITTMDHLRINYGYFRCQPRLLVAGDDSMKPWSFSFSLPPSIASAETYTTCLSFYRILLY